MPPTGSLLFCAKDDPFCAQPYRVHQCQITKAAEYQDPTWKGSRGGTASNRASIHHVDGKAKDGPPRCHGRVESVRQRVAAVRGAANSLLPLVDLLEQHGEHALQGPGRSRSRRRSHSGHSEVGPGHIEPRQTAAPTGRPHSGAPLGADHRFNSIHVRNNIRVATKESPPPGRGCRCSAPPAAAGPAPRSSSPVPRSSPARTACRGGRGGCWSAVGEMLGRDVGMRPGHRQRCLRAHVCVHACAPPSHPPPPSPPPEHPLQVQLAVHSLDPLHRRLLLLAVVVLRAGRQAEGAFGPAAVERHA